MLVYKRSNNRNFQDIVNPNSPKITQVVNEGQLSIIKPNVAHTMVFTKDTTFLNLVEGKRPREIWNYSHYKTCFC